MLRRVRVAAETCARHSFVFGLPAIDLPVTHKWSWAHRLASMSQRQCSSLRQEPALKSVRWSSDIAAHPRQSQLSQISARISPRHILHVSSPLLYCPFPAGKGCVRADAEMALLTFLSLFVFEWTQATFSSQSFYILSPQRCAVGEMWMMGGLSRTFV